MNEDSLEHKAFNGFILNDNFIRQSEETALVKPKINATAGVVMLNGKLMARNSVMSFYTEKTPENVVGYSPMTGIKELRDVWKKRILNHNDLIQSDISLPMVTSGITSSLAIVNTLFAGKNSRLFLPEMRWEAYDNIFKDAEKVIFYDSYLNDLPFERMNDMCSNNKDIRFIIVLNYPNNPTGWSPSERDLIQLSQSLLKIASTGRKIVVVVDDAYTGLFFEQQIQSPFAYFCNLENILAVKCDGATKECLMWGQRIGFITYGLKHAKAEDYEYLENLTKAAIRGLYSSPCTASQNALLKSEKSGLSEKESVEITSLLLSRYLEFKRVISQLGKKEFISPLPFNSGYFMCFKVGCNANTLRKKLLLEKEIGVISYDDKHIRVAWSSVDCPDIEKLITEIYKTAKELYEKDVV